MNHRKRIYNSRSVCRARGAFLPRLNTPTGSTICAQCRHRLFLHDAGDEGRCYHQNANGRFDCECIPRRNSNPSVVRYLRGACKRCESPFDRANTILKRRIVDGVSVVVGRECKRCHAAREARKGKTRYQFERFEVSDER